MEILKEQEMKLLSRKRFYLMVSHDGKTPTRGDLIKDIAKLLKVKENTVVIKHVYPQFGSRKTKIIVHVYDKPEFVSQFEQESLIKKHPGQQSEKPIEKKESGEAKEPVEEKKVEEKEAPVQEKEPEVKAEPVKEVKSEEKGE